MLTNGATEVCPRDEDALRDQGARVEEEEEAAEPLPLDKLAPEILNIIAEALADDEDVLIPRHLGSLARSCKAIKEAVEDAKDELEVEYTAASALLVKCGRTVERFVEERPTALHCYNKGLTAEDAPALTNVLKSKAMERVEGLYLDHNSLSDKGAAAIVAAAAGGGMPRLEKLWLGDNKIGDAGVQALASAIAGGAFRKLEVLGLGSNSIGNAGLAALAAALEKGALPNLRQLHLHWNEIGGEGLKALMAATGGGVLPKLEKLFLFGNLNGDSPFSEEGIVALAEAIRRGDLPSLVKVIVDAAHMNNPSLVSACADRNIEIA